MTKILILDIEWRPVTAYVWRAWDENISPAQIVQDGGLLCVGAKWFGEKDVFIFSEWGHTHSGMLESIHNLISQSDAVVGYNSDKYDLPKLRGEFLLHGLPTLPPLTSIDLIKTVKKLGFFMNRLAFIGPFLGLGKKLEHEGFSLWSKVLAGDLKAQRKMEKYCRQDVLLTESLYRKILPAITNHPNLRDERGTCGACGSHHLQSRGYRRTKYFKTQRLQCQTCGSWSDGKKEKIV